MNTNQLINAIEATSNGKWTNDKTVHGKWLTPAIRNVLDIDKQDSQWVDNFLNLHQQGTRREINVEVTLDRISRLLPSHAEGKEKYYAKFVPLHQFASIADAAKYYSCEVSDLS